MLPNLSNQLTKPFIAKARSFTKNMIIRKRKKCLSVSHDYMILKAGSITACSYSFTDSFTVIFSKGLKALLIIYSVTDIQNMIKANYKDNNITEAALVFFVVTFELF